MKLVGLLLDEKMIAGVDQIAHRGGKTRTEVLRAMIYRALFLYRYQGDHTLFVVPKFPKNLNQDPDKALVNGKVITVDDWGLIPPDEKLRPITRPEDLPWSWPGAAAAEQAEP